MSLSNAGDTVPASLQLDKRKKDYKRSGKMRTTTHFEPPQPEPLPVAKSRISTSSRKVKDREKDPGFNGADMYVARLGWCRGPAEGRVTAPKLPTLPDDIPEEDLEISSSTNSPLFPGTTALRSTTSSIPTSLHDELVNCTRFLVRTKSSSPQQIFSLSTVRASRPCYRCITYMHTVGIKRVFWTNDAGQWEGGKARSLVESCGCFGLFDG